MMPARNLAIMTSMRTAGRGVPVLGRGFTFSTSSRLGLKESTNSDNVDFDKHKADSLAKQKKGEGHWKPELASDSEEAVKADKGPDGPGETARLQEKTKRAAEETAKAGTSVREGM